MLNSKPLPKFLSEFNISHICPIAGDGGHRKYYRLITPNANFVLMQDPNIKKYKPNQDHDFLFVNVHTTLTKHHVSTPSIIKIFPDNECLILEDLGDTNLYNMTASQHELYQASIDELIKIQNISPKTELPLFKKSFDTTFLIQELTQSLISLSNFYFANTPLTTLSSQLTKEIFHFCKLLEKNTFCLVHRDFHSRNIMIKNNQVKIIDFQDARLGHSLYDLASLLEDPYTKLPLTEKSQLQKYYIENSTKKINDFAIHYHSISIHRLLKAAASFIKLSQGKNNKIYNYLTDLPYAIKQSHIYIKKLNYPALQNFITNLDKQK